MRSLFERIILLYQIIIKNLEGFLIFITYEVAENWVVMILF